MRKTTRVAEEKNRIHRRQNSFYLQPRFSRTKINDFTKRDEKNEWKSEKGLNKRKTMLSITHFLCSTIVKRIFWRWARQRWKKNEGQKKKILWKRMASRKERYRGQNMREKKLADNELKCSFFSTACLHHFLVTSFSVYFFLMPTLPPKPRENLFKWR